MIETRSVSLGLELDLNQDILKGSHARFCPRIDKIDVVVYPKGFSTELNIFGDKQPFDDILEKKKKKKRCASLLF